MKYLQILTAAAFILASCGKNENNDLASKKAELVKLQTSASDLQKQIKTLETEIAKVEPKKEDNRVITVTVMPLALQNFKHFIEVQGSLDAENNVLVSPKMGGAITNVSVKEGDYVKAGQAVARVDNSVLETSLQEIKVQLEMARTIYERQKALWDQKIGTEIAFIQAKTQVDALEKRIATLETQGRMTVVTSPISGYVDEVRQKAGEMAMPGLGIIRVVNFNNLKVVAKVADTFAGTVKKGDVVQIKFPDLGKEISARLSFVSQTVNPVSRTFLAEALIPNIDKQLKPNMLAIMNINDQSKGSTLVVPQNLVQRTEQGDIVYVVVQEANKQVAKSRIIKTGLSYDGNVEVISGLKTGDMLITQGYQELVDGQAVAY